jgi:Tfp pilus assembly protein PilF
MKAGDMNRAEKYYQKSIKLDPQNQNAKDMLKKIRGRK